MRRKDWSEGKRWDEIFKIGEQIDRLEQKMDHLQSSMWLEPYPKVEDK